jgi:hypothetical protein
VALTAAVRTVGPDGGGAWSPAVPFLAGTGRPAIAVIAGDGQRVARAGTDPPGGLAAFEPLRVLVGDGAGAGLPGVTVTFEAQAGASSLIAQIDPSGRPSVTRTTGPDGMAMLDAMPGGHSVMAYYGDGAFTVTATAPDIPGAVVFSLAVVAPRGR